jgi:hypothetical protein
MARDELGEVAPVRADVRERTRRAAELVVDAPVRVVGSQEPVLQIRAVQQMDRAGPSCSHALARLADGRIEAVDERDARVEARLRRELGEPLGAGEVGGERLLAHDVLARLERRLGERQVEVVGGADVDDVDVGVADELLGRVERARGAELGGPPPRRTSGRKRRRRRARRLRGGASARAPGR